MCFRIMNMSHKSYQQVSVNTEPIVNQLAFQISLESVRVNINIIKNGDCYFKS
jgi:hypothetical protein